MKEMKDKSILDDIKRYSSMGKLSVFIGAGVSALSGFPSWSILVKSMADEIGYVYKKDEKGNAVFSTEELLKVPQIYYLQKDESAYKNKVKEGFANTCKPNEVHSLILSLHPNHILTTNYDTLLEETSVKFGRNFSVLNSNNVVSKAETTNYIIKVHGDFAANFVLKEQDYLDYEQDYILIDNIVKTIFATNLVIFIGYGLNDYNIKLILNWVKHVQSDSFVMPIFIHTGDKVDENEMIYQNGRGLRILDCNHYTDSKEWNEKYASVLKAILFHNEDNEYLEKYEKLQYLYDKIIGICNLNYIKREDFKSIFNNEYELDDIWQLENKTKSFKFNFDEKENFKLTADIKVDYFEDYLKNKEIYKKINKIQCDQVEAFLNKSGFMGIEDKGLFKVSNVEIDSLAFKSDFVEMKKYCLKEYDTVKDNYKKAYYLAQLGNYANSYNLYTEILSMAKQEEKWDIYYFAQINRQYLFSIIAKMTKLTTGFQGVINFGKKLKLFYDNFLDQLEHEMGKLKIKNIFLELPYEIKTKYSFLEAFSNANCNLDKYYQLTKDKYEIEKDLMKQTLSLGISKFDKVKLDMLEMEKFLYENMILFERFDENKVYVKTSLMLWFQAYINEISKDGEDIFQIFSNTRYSFTVQDIILMSKTFVKDDISYFDMLIKNTIIPFERTEELELYIYNYIEMYNKMFKNTIEGSDIFLWKLSSEEIKVLISISPYFIKNNDCKLKIVEFICEMADGHFNVHDRVNLINKWVRIADVKNASTIIEKWFEEKYKYYSDRRVQLQKQELYCQDIAEISSLLCGVFMNDDYKSEIISEIVINDRILDFKYIQDLYPILNDEARKVYDNKHIIDNVYELMRRGYEKTLPFNCNEKEVIAKFFDNILKERKDNDEKKVIKYTISSEEENIAKVAAYMYMREIPYEFTRLYNSISDEYDFLLNPNAFDAKKLKIDWLFSYSNDLILKIKNNEKQRKMLITAINNNGLSYKKEKIKRLFEIYLMLNDTK